MKEKSDCGQRKSANGHIVFSFSLFRSVCIHLDCFKRLGVVLSQLLKNSTPFSFQTPDGLFLPAQANPFCRHCKSFLFIHYTAFDRTDPQTQKPCVSLHVNRNVNYKSLLWHDSGHYFDGLPDF